MSLSFFSFIGFCLPVSHGHKELFCSFRSDDFLWGGCFRYNRGSDFVRNVALEVSKSNYAYEFEGKMSPSK